MRLASGCLSVILLQALYSPVALAVNLPDAELEELLQLMRSQQQELAAHRQLLEQQSAAIDKQNKVVDSLRSELDALRGHSSTVTEDVGSGISEEPVAATRPSLQAGSLAVAEALDKKERAELDELLTAQQDDPTRSSLKDFKGSFRVPGTRAAIRLGGYVKTSGVYNFDPLQSQDRFIVGSIPPDDIDLDVAAETSISVSQSRLNFELREPTSAGLMRAFIEGDFAGDGDTFRLRHAFGQYKRLLAGKTWSTFVDAEATPEDIDFEGLNARVNVRQALLRFSPRFGEKYEFQFSLEDPNPAVDNGNGVSRFPDVLASIRIASDDYHHVKLAGLLRQVRGQWDEGDGGDGSKEEELGVGLSLSARRSIPWLDPRDNLLFQLNAGHGIGRYINDLSAIGDFDGIFDPETGDLELLDVAAGYFSGQHWWGTTLRSNFTLGLVYVDEPDFADEKAYDYTIRASGNLLWSPMPRVQLGGEFLWGKRENIDGSSGEASQFQMAAKYRF
jgi:hypothetical protein